MSLPLSRQLEELHTGPFVAVNGHPKRCVRLGHADHPGNALNLPHFLPLPFSGLFLLLSQLECYLEDVEKLLEDTSKYQQTFGFFSFV